MKTNRILILLTAILLCMVLVLSACVDDPEENDNTDGNNQQEVTEMYVTINDNKLKVKLANNAAVKELVAMLQQGDVTFTADRNGNFEMYGDVGRSFTTSNTQISATAGDVLLYAGRYLCFFYGSNSYSYTRIGKIEGYSASQLKTLLGADQNSVQVSLSLQ